MDAQMIREAREKVGESQSTFGARFGVHQTTIDRWETSGPPARGPARMAIEREVNQINQQPAEARAAS